MIGSLQFWTDFAWQDGWRLQQHASTENWRLLDPANQVQAFGSRDICQLAYEQQLRTAEKSQQDEPHYVLLIHGLSRTANCMNRLKVAISSSETGIPIAFGYASTRLTVQKHAFALRQFIESLHENAKLSIVAHSLGNIVTRHLLGDLKTTDDPKQILHRLHKIVMLGPPNQGAEIARRLGKLSLFKTIMGPSAMELGLEWNQLSVRLGIPSCPYMIIAGDTSKRWLRNPMLGAANDFLVLLDETRLDGCKRFQVVPFHHALLMTNAQVVDLTLDFLREQ